jgi:hypothetical protein
MSIENPIKRYQADFGNQAPLHEIDRINIQKLHDNLYRAQILYINEIGLVDSKIEIMKDEIIIREAEGDILRAVVNWIFQKCHAIPNIVELSTIS